MKVPHISDQEKFKCECFKDTNNHKSLLVTHLVLNLNVWKSVSLADVLDKLYSLPIIYVISS